MLPLQWLYAQPLGGLITQFGNQCTRVKLYPIKEEESNVFDNKKHGNAEGSHSVVFPIVWDF